jgi:hypothetical protein
LDEREQSFAKHQVPGFSDFAWQAFSCVWDNAIPGRRYLLLSQAFDANGDFQPFPTQETQAWNFGGFAQNTALPRAVSISASGTSKL